MQLESNGISDYEVSTLTSKLIAEIFNTKKYRLIEREKIDLILKEQGFQTSGCTSSECLVEVGQIIGVELILGGIVGKVGQTFMISVRLIDVENGEITNTSTLEFRGEIDALLTDIIPEIAKDITLQYIRTSNEFIGEWINDKDIPNSIYRLKIENSSNKL